MPDFEKTRVEECVENVNCWSTFLTAVHKEIEVKVNHLKYLIQVSCSGLDPGPLTRRGGILIF